MRSFARFAALAGMLAIVPAHADSIYYYAGELVCNSVDGCITSFNNNQPTITVSKTVDVSPGGDLIDHESATASANLTTGDLHVSAQGFTIDNAPPVTFTDFAEAFLGDTIRANGSGFAGGHLFTTLTLSGHISEFLNTPDSNITNVSFVELYFDPVGAFDGGPFTPYAAYWWSLGADADTGHPPNATFMGVLPQFSSTSDQTVQLQVDVPFDVIGNEFQMAIGVGAAVFGNGTGGASWDADFGHTLQVSLSTSPEVQLTSAGGIAGTEATTPEPGTFGLLLAGFVLGIAGKRRSRNLPSHHASVPVVAAMH